MSVLLRDYILVYKVRISSDKLGIGVEPCGKWNMNISCDFYDLFCSEFGNNKKSTPAETRKNALDCPYWRWTSTSEPCRRQRWQYYLLIWRILHRRQLFSTASYWRTHPQSMYVLCSGFVLQRKYLISIRELSLLWFKDTQRFTVTIAINHYLTINIINLERWGW